MLTKWYVLSILTKLEVDIIREGVPEDPHPEIDPVLQGNAGTLPRAWALTVG